jgi:hypothetical protein
MLILARDGVKNTFFSFLKRQKVALRYILAER